MANLVGQTHTHTQLKLIAMDYPIELQNELKHLNVNCILVKIDAITNNCLIDLPPKCKILKT